jgi:flagellar protein FliJ
MKKFRFRLQTLLKLRQQQEDQKQRVVGALLTELNEQQRQALEMAAAVRAEGDRLREQHARGAIDLEWASHYRRYVTYMQQAINKRIEAVAQIQQRLARARQELAEAAKQTKILEKLRDRRKNRYDLELRRQDQREQDEIATRNFIRSRHSA